MMKYGKKKFREWVLRALADRHADVQRTLEELDARVRRVGKAARIAEVKAETAERRAQCIVSMDVPYSDRARGLVSLSVVVNGRPIVKCFSLPPMTFSNFKELTRQLTYHYGAVDYADVPQGHGALHEFLELRRS